MIKTHWKRFRDVLLDNICRTPNEDEFKTHTHSYNLSFNNQIGRVNITITVLLYKYITSLKCKHLSLGGPSTNRIYTIKNDLENVIIQQTREERNLGITFTNDLNIYNLSIRKANKMLGIVYRSFQHLTPTIFCMLYVSLVRPHLDYASVVWKHWLFKDVPPVWCHNLVQ